MCLVCKNGTSLCCLLPKLTSIFPCYRGCSPGSNWLQWRSDMFLECNEFEPDVHQDNNALECTPLSTSWMQNRNTLAGTE